MENQHIILLAAGCVFLYFLWMNCSNEGFDDDEGFEDEEFRNARRAIKRGAQKIVRGARKAGKGVAKGFKKKGGKKRGAKKGGGKRRNMTGMTFVCKAVDFGSMGGKRGHSGHVIGPSAARVGPSAIARSKGRGGPGMSRRGPRKNASRGLVADLKTKKGRRQRRTNM
jgi:hypothetical protein